MKNVDIYFVFRQKKKKWKLSMTASFKIIIIFELLDPIVKIGNYFRNDVRQDGENYYFLTIFKFSTPGLSNYRSAYSC